MSESVWKKYRSFLIANPFLVFTWLVTGLILAFLLLRPDGYGWDFKNYWVRTGDWLQGKNPFNVGWPYTYPPITFHLIRPFTALPLLSAWKVWFFLKCIGALVMLHVWHKYFYRLDSRKPWVVLFLLLAFNGAFFYDLASGNITGFLMMILWLGFAALLKGRTLYFCAAVILAAAVKADLLFFSSLLLVWDRKPLWKHFFLTIITYAGIYSLNYVMDPFLFQEYGNLLKLMPDWNRGVDNMSTLAFISDLWDSFKRWNHPLYMPIPAMVAYVGWVGAVLAVSFWTFRRYRMRVSDTDKRFLIGFFCVIFCAIDPRVPPYMYVAALLPSLMIVEKTPDWLKFSIPALLVMLPRSDSSFPAPFAMSFKVFNMYLQLLGLYFVWFLYLLYFQRAQSASLAPTEK